MAATAEGFATWLVGEGRAANTVAAYRRDVASYLGWLATSGHDVRDASGDDLARYLDHLGATQRTSSVARALAAIRMFYRWASSEGIRSDDLSSRLGASGDRAPSPRAALQESEIDRVIAATDGAGLEARRDRALLLILYRCGLKATEIVALDVTDVADGHRAIAVDRLGAHPRTLPVAVDASRALTAWLGPLGRGRFEGGSRALFPNQRGNRLTRQGLWLITRLTGERAGLDGRLAPKDLRHACSTGLAQRSMRPEEISALLGHGQGKPPSLEELTRVGWGEE